MGWREQLIKASFMGVPFFVQGHEGEVGRRVQVHEFPLRDKPWAEDLGRKARTFTMDAYVLGSDYMQQRNALLRAVETAGAGLLQHPYLGQLKVTCVGALLRETTAEGGMARFALKFVEAGDAQFPSATVSTPAAVADAADYAAMAVRANFERRHKVGGCPRFVALETATIFSAALGDMRAVASTVRTVAAPLALLNREIEAALADAVTLAYEPAALATSLASSLKQLVGNVVPAPRDALRLARLFYSFGSTLPEVRGSTANRRQQASNQEEMLRLVRVLAMAEGARTAARSTFDSYQDALSVRDALSDALDDAMLQDIDDELYGALRELRAALVADVTARGANLARVVKWSPSATMPALVAAQRLYGDARREGELVARNAIRHPLFVGGGKPLEVLDDGK